MKVMTIIDSYDYEPEEHPWYYDEVKALSRENDENRRKIQIFEEAIDNIKAGMKDGAEKRAALELLTPELEKLKKVYRENEARINELESL